MGTADSPARYLAAWAKFQLRPGCQYARFFYGPNYIKVASMGLRDNYYAGKWFRFVDPRTKDLVEQPWRLDLVI
jgi:hypothetical protein